MLAETYEKFKLQLKAQKTGNEQLPEVLQTSDEQVHYICSYNHYPVKGDDIKLGLIHNDVYNLLMSLHMNLNMASSKTLLKVSN